MIHLSRIEILVRNLHNFVHFLHVTVGISLKVQIGYEKEDRSKTSNSNVP